MADAILSPAAEWTPYRMTNDKHEFTMQGRMLLAFVLVFGVIFATPYFYKIFVPPAPPKQAVTEFPKKPAAATTAAAPAVPAPVTAPPAGTIAGSREESTVIDTDLYHVIFTNRGGVVRSWSLKKFKDSAGKPLEIANFSAFAKTGNPFAFTFRDKKPSVDLNQVLFLAKENPDGHSVSFEYSDGHVFARKVFEFQKDSYVSTVSSEVTQDGAPILNLLQWRGGFGDFAALNASGQQSEIRYDTAEGKVLRDTAKAAKEGPRNTDGTFSFAGLEDQYFTAVFLPTGNGATETTIFSDTVASPFEKEETPFVGTAVGGTGHTAFSLFVGPKDVDTLRKVNPKLEQIVDFGWFAIIAKPLFLILHFLNDQYVHNYGWSIILITVIINVLLFPLKLTNMKSMKKMQRLQPQIAVINEKYKNIPMRDPRQQQKNQETMDLYKKNGANPVGGCLPLLIQMPFLFAFYKVLSVSIEMRSASWYWVHDLSQPELGMLGIRFLPLLLIATGFLMQKMTPTAGGDPAQQKMMQFMPLMMGFFFWKASSGLVLYWLTGNLVGILQQWFFNKTMTPAEVLPMPKIARKSGAK
ncbi:MAG: membrane protein insertase YidC [Acidobacteriota bacterium]|nr:membrane protein insertase YidC [Acidobacteriota bacterium]